MLHEAALQPPSRRPSVIPEADADAAALQLPSRQPSAIPEDLPAAAASQPPGRQPSIISHQTPDAPALRMVSRQSSAMQEADTEAAADLAPDSRQPSAVPVSSLREEDMQDSSSRVTQLPRQGQSPSEPPASEAEDEIPASTLAGSDEHPQQSPELHPQRLAEATSVQHAGPPAAGTTLDGQQDYPAIEAEVAGERALEPVSEQMNIDQQEAS